MNTVLKIVSACAVIALVALPISYFSEALEKQAMITGMLLATVAWFISAPFWIGKEEQSNGSS